LLNDGELCIWSDDGSRICAVSVHVGLLLQYLTGGTEGNHDALIRLLVQNLTTSLLNKNKLLLAKSRPFKKSDEFE
jgi:hypothetical protein